MYLSIIRISGLSVALKLLINWICVEAAAGTMT